MQQQKQLFLSRIQSQAQFQKIFNDINNSSCFQCGKQCKQWVDVRHAIYLCLTCSIKYMNIPRVVRVKSVSLDIWTQQQIDMLKRGGNQKFKQYLTKYGLQAAQPQIALKSNAAQFYRLYLLNPEKLELSDAPAMQNGSNYNYTSIAELKPDQILQQVQIRLNKGFQTTKYYGNQAYETIHHKISTGQYKEDAKKVVGKVNETAKNIWQFIANSVDLFNKQGHNKENMA